MLTHTTMQNKYSSTAGAPSLSLSLSHLRIEICSLARVTDRHEDRSHLRRQTPSSQLNQTYSTFFGALHLGLGAARKLLFPDENCSKDRCERLEMAGILGKLWDDVAGGSPPEKGLKQLRKLNSGNAGQFPDVPNDARRIMERRLSSGSYQSPGGSPTSQNIAITKPERVGKLDIDDSPVGSISSTPPASPSMAASPSTYSREKDNIWRSVFHPGQNKVMRKVGSDKFDKAQPNSPTVYDWLYSADTKSEYR